MENWKWIEKYEGFYEISDQGNIRSVDRVVKCGKGTRLWKGILRKLAYDKDGYFITALCKKSKREMVKVHRLVAQAFIPNIDKKPVVNHINGIKNDNRVENLEWCTSSENTNHAMRIGTLKIKGEDSYASKLKEEDIEVIFKLRYEDGWTLEKIANNYNVGYKAIHKIVKAQRWKHITEDLIKKYT